MLELRTEGGYHPIKLVMAHTGAGIMIIISLEKTPTGAELNMMMKRADGTHSPLGAQKKTDTTEEGERLLESTIKALRETPPFQVRYVDEVNFPDDCTSEMFMSIMLQRGDLFNIWEADKEGNKGKKLAG